MIAFIHTHKTAGTSMKWILRSSFGLKHLDILNWDESKIPHNLRINHSPVPIKSTDLKRAFKFLPHVKSILGHSVMGYSDLELMYPDMQYCTFMRDPIKQTASWYQYLKNVGDRKELNFKDYMKTEFPRNRQTKMISGSENLEEAINIIKQKNIFIGITEKFDESLLLFKNLYCPELRVNYARRGIADDKSIYNSLLENDETYQILLDATKIDRQLYKIVHDDIYPNYLKSYKGDIEKDLIEFKSKKKNYNMFNVNLSRIQSVYFYQKILLKAYRKGKIK